MIAVTEKAERVLNYFYGTVKDWGYYVAPSPDWVAPRANFPFVAYRKNLFSGEIQLLAGGQSQSEVEKGVNAYLRRFRAASCTPHYKQVVRVGIRDDESR